MPPAWFKWVFLLVSLPLLAGLPLAVAQEDGGDTGTDATPASPSADAEATDDDTATTEEIPASGTGGGTSTAAKGLNPLELVLAGGIWMIPIGLMSLLVVTIGIERFISLRRSRVMPVPLIEGLGQLSGAPGGFDPRKAYRLCQQYPSSTANIIRAMLLKVGRPHSEVEHAVKEVSEREATRLYSNVRWLTLAAAVTPLMGLLGTVWGMIVAFHETTQLQPGQNKADFLAEGIYIALVTTLSGLVVAIPAAILAHSFEGRVQSLFHQIDELLFSLLPQIERYEGRLRVSRQQLGEEETQTASEALHEEPVSA